MKKRAVDSFSSKKEYTLNQLLSMYKDKKDDMYILYLQLKSKDGTDTPDSLKVLSSITPKFIPVEKDEVKQWYKDRITEMITLQIFYASKKGQSYMRDITNYVREKVRRANPDFYNSWENEFPPQGDISVVGNTIWDGSRKIVFHSKGKVEYDIYDPDCVALKAEREEKHRKYRKKKKKVIEAIKRKKQRERERLI